MGLQESKKFWGILELVPHFSLNPMSFYTIGQVKIVRVKHSIT
jgi:hypothetical protein